ncbi:MAG: protein translocase subunit SecD [Phycisphaeraceae bacterium]|nr:protein translocase subunit SecD [Phycisphaeraceae bacterium]
MAITFLLIIAALFLGSAVLYAMNIHWWRVSLIAAVMFGAVALLWVPGVYGPEDRLKPGIDLAGGTRLVYDVVIPDSNANRSTVIEETIAILSDRVDPNGTRNLVWKEVAGNRIEVQMASAPSKVREARKAFDDAMDQLKRGNLTQGELDRALKAGGEQSLKNLAGSNTGLLEDLEEIQVLFNDRTQAKEDYDNAAAAWNAIPRDKRDDNQGVYDKFIKAEEFYFDAADRFSVKEADLLSANSFSQAQFDFLQDIPPQELSEKDKAAGVKTARQEKLESLLGQYPNRAEEIQTAYDTMVAYEAVKGPLDGPEDLIALLRGSGVLEFRVGADPQDPLVTPFLRQLDEQGPRARPDADFRWFEIDELEQYVDDAPDRKRVEEWLLESLDTDPIVQGQARNATANYFGDPQGRNVVARPYAGRLYILLHNETGMSMTRDQDWVVTGVNSAPGELGRPVVNFSLDGKGSSLMGTMTGQNLQRPMAVLIDDKVLTTPSIRARLTAGVQISGDFSAAEIKYLRDTMRAGSLEGQLSESPVSQQTIGPGLGADNVAAGFRAAITSIILVAIFMAIYYFFAGMVANFALAANMVLILGVLAMTQATFTLPGIAGLVLTIGMAVDANVLIFERIREELMDRKVAVEIAVRQGYGKALSTILDANITTLITCLILGYTATSDVKGFAVVLGIGILATLFTALFCTKVLLDLYVRYRKPKTLEMLPTMIPAMHKLMHPKVKWISKAKFVLPISAILLIGGLTEAFAVRGVDMLDIEFRSGTAVGFDLKPTDEEDEFGDPVLTTLNIGDARDRIEAVALLSMDAQEAIEADANYDPPSDKAAEVFAAVKASYDRHEAAMAEYDRLAGTGRIDEPDPMADFSLLKEVQVISTGQNEDPEVSSGFNVATLITDSQAVADLLKIAFDDVLQSVRTIEFAGQDIDAKDAKDVVEPMESGLLSDVYEDLPANADVNLPDFAGGVAMLVEDMTPALSTQQVTERIERMRRQPPHDELGPRDFTVVPVDEVREGDQDNRFDDAGNLLYKSVIVVAHDNGSTDYSDPVVADRFGDTNGLADTEWKLVKDALQRDSSFSNVTVFNSQVSGTMKQQAIVAIFLSLLAVVIYIWIRFGSIRYGLAAIAALVHDVAVALGVIALAGLAYNQLGADSPIVQFLMLDPFKINLAMIAAFLTIIGYSLNDTIVVFDRIRENRGRLSRATPEIINDSINQTISRTVLTSGTTLLAVGTLYVLGGDGIHGFAFAMLLGVLVGTYSSIAVAAPILTIGTKGQGPASGPQPAKPVDDEPEISSEPVTA